MPLTLILGPFTLNIYTALVAVAGLASLGWMWQEPPGARTLAVAPAVGLAVALAVAVCAVLAGRAGYVALNWDYFREHTAQILALNGLSEHAALVGGLVGYELCSIGCRLLAKTQRSVPHSPISILPSQLFVGLAASLGCIPNGCAFGREVFWQTDGASSLAWLLRQDWPDAFGVSNPRWATQLLMALWLATAFVLLLWLRRRGVAPRWQATLAVMAFAAGDFLIQFLRGDGVPVWNGLRLYQWFDVAALLGVGCWLVIRFRGS